MQQLQVDEIVRRAQQRDRAAFGELYELYGRKLYAYFSYNLGSQQHAAEDLTEEVFLKLLEKIDGFRFTGVPFTAWMYRIAHNHLVDYVRHQKRETAFSLEETPPSLEPCDSQEEELELRLSSQGLKEALHQLTFEQRQVILLRFVQDLSIADTARIMGKGEDAVKKLQSRALKSLKRILSREDDFDGC